MNTLKGTVKIAGLGKYLPEKILANTDLEKLVDTSDEWITTRTGIKERRIAAKGETASTLGAQAAKDALKKAGLAPKDIDLIITATVTPDNSFPSTSCYIQHILGAKNAGVFDVSAACAGYIYSLVLSWALVGGGFYKNALVIGTEVLSSITDWNDRSTCVLFGDGAGACVIVPHKKKGQGFLSMNLGGDGSFANILNLPAGGSRIPASLDSVKQGLHYIKMQGNELFKIAVRVMVDCALKALDSCSLSLGSIDLLIPHQANMRIVSAIGRRLGLARENIFSNIHKYGNTSSASIAIALCEAYEEGRISEDDIVLLDAFGGGLVWGALLMKWA